MSRIVEKGAAGQRIKKRRLEMGIGQSELADRIGKRPHTVYRYEVGAIEPSAVVAAQIARELQVSPRWLVLGEDDDSDGVDRSGEPPYAAWKEFLATNDVKMAEPWMMDNLRRLRTPKGKIPTLETYRRLLFAMLSIEGEDPDE